MLDERELPTKPQSWPVSAPHCPDDKYVSKRLSFHDSMDLSSSGKVEKAYVSFVFHQC